MKALSKSLLLGAIVVLTIANKAQGAALCEISYTNRNDLEQTLKSQKGQFFAGKDVLSVLVSSPTRLSLWWLTLPSSRAYPTIACVEKRREHDGIFRQHKAQSNCHGAEQNNCKELRSQIAKAKF